MHCELYAVQFDRVFLFIASLGTHADVNILHSLNETATVIFGFHLVTHRTQARHPCYRNVCIASKRLNVFYPNFCSLNCPRQNVNKTSNVFSEFCHPCPLLNDYCYGWHFLVYTVKVNPRSEVTRTHQELR